MNHKFNQINPEKFFLMEAYWLPRHVTKNDDLNSEKWLKSQNESGKVIKQSGDGQ